MASKRLLYTIFFALFFSFIPFSNCLQEKPLHNYLGEESAYAIAPPQVCPSYFGTFEDLSKFRTDVLSLKRYDIVGSISTSGRKFSVDGFGAKADGTDDTEAFVKAWEGACSVKGGVLVVPYNTYLLKPVRFSGPCKSNITVQIYGTIEASNDRSDYEDDRRHWLVFDTVQSLLIEGGGTIDGNGKIWWQNSCKVNKALPCKEAPTALTFYKCKNLGVKDLKIQNAQQMHISFQSSMNVEVSNLSITSPKDSPNTDGIHVTATQNIRIRNSVIGTGDDCISIVSGSENVEASDIICGPGHGISIGSLGSKNSKEYVSGVTVDGAKLYGTSNGVRIKTWQGGSGTASNIKFQNIEMENVTNPIIIDQNYCDQKKPCKEESSAVQVKDVVYKNIKGTSASDVAIKFDCSETHPCQGILLQDVTLKREGQDTARAICDDVQLAQLGVVSPRCP